MITKPTTFIVGAGASQPYGLPVGRKLKSEAIEQLNEPNNDVFRLIRIALNTKDASFKDSRLAVKHIEYFLEHLKEHPGDSIDEFLEDRRNEPIVVSIGRAVIAVLLGGALKSGVKALPTETDWLREVIRTMRINAATPDEFVEKNNQLRFVTFNFDTIIEQRLPRFIHQLYGGSSTKALPQVIHVHGQLQDVPQEPFLLSGHHISSLWVQWIIQTMDRINVTSDTIEESILSEARAAISTASVVHFTGFS